jgi:zinc protease
MVRILQHRLPILFIFPLFMLPLIAGAQTTAPAAQQPALALADRIPFDSAVTRGTLPNGLTYYIRKNTRPEKRVLMQLAVKAGSVDETDEQQGLAHVLEHMAFNGSKRFKPGELIAALEATGARFGPHLNAYTSFDETVYMFQLPTDKEGIVLKGMQALADFAGGITLDPKEIDKERGVVIEEWRSGLGAGSRLRDQQIPVLYYKSRYAERLPIGKPEVLKTFTPEQLRAFYTKWYRPDRMAVVVVGDIDAAQMESLIKTEFGPLAKPAAPAPERNYPVPLPPDMQVKVATDPEATQSSVSLLRKRPGQDMETVQDYRATLVRQLVSQMMNERFDEISRKPDAPFLGAAAYGGNLSPTVDTFTLGASVQEGRIERGLSALVVEANRVNQHGFGPSELERAKSWVLASYERAYSEREKTESGSYVQEYINHFLLDEPSPGIAYEFQLVKQFVPAITAAEVAEAAQKVLAEGSPVILAVSPQKPDITIPAEAELAAAVKAANAVAVTAWNDAASGRELMPKTPQAGKIVERREIPELGVTVVRFENGVDAWLKPTDFKNDQVLFSLIASGGASLADPAKYVEAQFAPGHAALSGAGGHRAVDLEKLLAGKFVSASASIGLSSHGIAGSSQPANLETALQLLNLRFTAPGDEDEAFALLKRQLDAALLNRERSPGILFAEKVNAVNTSNHYTSRPLTVERVAALDRAAMVSIYRERFSNAADFTFFIVGAFKTDDALPLIAKYVGSLPSAGKRTSTFKDARLEFPATTQRATVVKGKEPRMQTVLSFFADPPIEENEQTRVEAATEVLEISLRDILREELGETYGVSVGLSQPLPQRGAGYIAVSFTSAPENAPRMTERVFQEVERLQREGPSEDLTTRAKESARRQHETSLRENGFWLGRLQSARLLNRDPLLILKRLERIDAVTPAVLHETFKKYFPRERHTIVTLEPEQPQLPTPKAQLPGS